MRLTCFDDELDDLALAGNHLGKPGQEIKFSKNVYTSLWNWECIVAYIWKLLLTKVVRFST